MKRNYMTVSAWPGEQRLAIHSGSLAGARKHAVSSLEKSADPYACYHIYASPDFQTLASFDDDVLESVFLRDGQPVYSRTPPEERARLLAEILAKDAAENAAKALLK